MIGSTVLGTLFLQKQYEKFAVVLTTILGVLLIIQPDIMVTTLGYKHIPITIIAVLKGIAIGLIFIEWLNAKYDLHIKEIFSISLVISWLNFVTYTSTIYPGYDYEGFKLIYPQEVSLEGTMFIGMIISGILGGLIYLGIKKCRMQLIQKQLPFSEKNYIYYSQMTLIVLMVITLVGGIILWKYNSVTYKNPIIEYFGGENRERIPLFPLGERKRDVLPYYLGEGYWEYRMHLNKSI